MAEEKKAKKVFTLDEIKYNEKNQWLGVLACVPIVGLVLMFIEKEDNFVRYFGAQYTIVAAILFVLGIIPIIGWALAYFMSMLELVLIIVGMVKAYKGERFDIPVISGWALKLLSAIS